jgi:hypothetical protein
MSGQKAAPGRTRKNQKYGDLVKKVAKECRRSKFTVYAVLTGRMQSRHIADAIDAYCRAVEPAKAADETGPAK